MEAELVEKLSRINEFSDELVNILTAIIRDIHRPAWDSHTSKLAVILVNFTCQPKISYMRKSPSATIAINNANKTLEDYCMDLILQLLLKMLKLKDDMVHKLTELFLEVIEMNINNVDAIVLLYRAMFFSEKVVNYILENNYLGIFIEQYEKIINQILREFDNTERSTFVSETLRSYFYGGSDFYSNLSKHAQAIGNLHPFELNSGNNLNIPEEDFDTNTPNVNVMHTPHDPLGGQAGTNNPNSEQSSFYLPQGAAVNYGSSAKSVKIPILNLPASFNDGNVNTVSRSTRRADPYKSFSTNSNRLSNYGVGSSSIDYGAAKDSTFQKQINENNISILENENSYMYEENLNKTGVYQSAQEKMKHLASQLGEFCLTIDLGCLLAQNRKLQLDRVAKVAVYQDVDTIMDFKAEEKILREKFRKKKHKSTKKGKLSRKSAGLGLGMNPEIKEVESSENSECSDAEGHGAKEENKATPQKAHSRKSADRSDKKSDKQAARNKKMQELKQSWKASHVLANILLLLLKEVEYEKLQQYGSLVNIMYLALSTDISQRFRLKEKAKLSLSMNYWIDNMDDEFNKHEELCEGIDNVERINRHFEKTLVDKYKARQAHIQQNNAIGNIAANIPNNPNQPVVPSHFSGNAPHVNNPNFSLNNNLSHHPNAPGHASTLKSFTIGGNDSKKKGNLGQKSLTFFDMNTTNMKYFDSTVLHFSTTYDNTNSSAITIPDESIDSLDELNTNQNLMNLDFILLPENVVYFKILDLFSVVSEKVHETLTTKYQNAFEVEKLIDDPTSALSETSVPFSQPKPKSQTEKDKLLDITNLVSKHPDNSHFKIFIKGLYMNPAEDYNTKVIKKKVNLFLHKYEKKLTWILNQVDMNSVFFYDMEVEQLEILEGYLSSSTSKVTVFEVLENVFELLLLIKKQILDLSTSFLGGQGGTNTTTTRIASPNLTAKAYRPGSITREFPTPSAPTSSTNIANNILKSVLKTNPSSRNMPANDLSPQRVISEDKEKPRSATVYSPSFSNSFIYKQKALFTSYLGIITRLITRAPSSNVYTLMNDVFASSENWMELVKLFTVSIFREVTAICERIGDSNQIPIEKEQIQLFIYAKKILEYYTSILVMCNVTIFKEKLNTGPVEAEKKKWKNTLRKILQSMLYLVKPNGVLANYIQTNTNLNSTIINPRIQSLSNYNLIRIHLFKSIYDFLRKVFSFDSRFSCFLGEDIVTFYIRFSYINFVKLYSHSSNSELNEINRKIAEIGNRVKSKAGQENFNENIDRLENEFNRRNPKPGNNEMKNYQIHLSKLYIKVLLAIAKNRTENINHKFYQYRILEFFTREIDLEFDISQIRERFLRIRNELKRMAEKKEQEGSSQPPQPQPLRIPARTATVEEPEEESKERQDTYQSDVRVTNISDADGQSKKFSIPGLRMSPGLGPLPYHLHKGAGHKEGIFTIEENNNQRSYLSEEFANSHMVEPIPNASETPSPKSTTLQKKNARTKSNPFGQEEMLDVPKLYSQMDITPPFGDSQAENDPFDQSNISNDNRSPHVVFQKRFAIPSLNLHGHTSSYYTGGAGSIGNSPFKTEMPKTLFEAESELQQEEKKFTLNLQKAHGPEGKRKSQVEQISELELNDDRSSVTGEHMEQHGQYRADKTIQNKLKGVIKQELGLRKVVSSSKQQEPKQSTKLDASSQRKMRTSLASIDNEKLSVQSRRRLELNEQKEGGVGSTRRTVSRQEISDREFTNQPSSKRTVGSRMSPIRPVQIQEVRQEEDIDRQKGFYVDPNVEEQKFETEGMNDMHDTVVVNEEEEPNQHEMSNQYPGAPPIETERTDGMSDISMGEMIQREMEYKKALAEQQKGKKTIPSLKLPSFLVEKGNLYGVDAKYAGSPRDVDEHSDKEEEKEHVRPSMRMNESLQSQGNHNPFAKKLKVPSLKIGGLGGNKEEMIYRPHHEDLEKLQDSYTLGNLTQLEHSLNASNPKMQLLLEGKRKHHSPKMNLKNLTKEFSLNNANMDETLTENLFYYSERKLRKLYEDDELHVLVISLMVTLLLSPNRGTLDEYYTSQYPIDDNKPNILYIMHFHLNHASNQHILPLLLQKMAEVKPFPAGQRLLKLLCISFSDMSIYTDKKKIGGGAYGTIFECNTNLADPRTVAIKETKFPSSIHDRCALHDIFNEIACLEQFRLDPAVTDIYDYGVTDSSYIIVMKKYPFSLKDWRLKQEGNWMDHLPTYLTIYRDILKAIAMLHDNNITHYDLKCDNILLDSKTNNTMKWNSESDIRVVLGDFGECKMFTNEQEELCLRNRGTEYIKSPEMLTLTINCKRENDNFDRRRKVGTTRASDIWSLGCLLYEILTGDFLFYDTDWIRFYIRVTSPNETLLTEERLSKIQNNNYIVDFLKYILVRDPHHRPSIHHVLARFEHIHALLVSNLSYVDHNALTLAPHSVASNHASLEGTLESYVELLFSNQEAIQEKVTVPHKLKHPPTYIKLMEEISICSKTYFLTNTDKLVRNRITHVVTTSNLIEEKYLSRFKYMLIQLADDQRLHMLPYILAPQMMDYLRVVFLYKGNILFVEDDNISINSKPSKLVLRTSLLFCLTHFFKCSVYETWALLNSQVLFFSLPFAHLSMMSNLMIHHLKLAQLVQALPKIQCICGCCTIILKRHFTLEKNINVKPCACSRESKNIDYSDCPSDGCHEYIKYMKEKYKMPWDLLKWGYFGANDFFIGPKGTGVIQDKFHCKVILNSEGVLENSMIYQKKYRKPNTSYASLGNPNKDKWDLYQCKFCMMWLFAENKLEGRYAVVTNNKLNPREGGIMTPHPRLGSKIKTPTLRNFKLADLI